MREEIIYTRDQKWPFQLLPQIMNQNATSPTPVGRFLSHVVVFSCPFSLFFHPFIFTIFFFQNQAPERRSGVLGGRLTSQIPFQACCASVTMLGPRLVEPQHIELQRTHATTHRRLGGSDTWRQHAHLMSTNDAHPGVFTEWTRAPGHCGHRP